MTAFNKLKALQELREQRLKTIAKSMRREKIAPITDLNIALAELDNTQTDGDIRWRFLWEN